MKKVIANIIKSSMIIASLVGVVGSTVLTPSVAYADNVQEAKQGVNAIGGNESGNRAVDFTNLIQSIINILLFVIGAVAVIMIIIGGIRYTTSNGDQGQVTAAKNTIMYSVVGLVVAIMAYSIVNFVLRAL